MPSPDDFLGKRYRVGSGYMHVIGVITDPAMLLRDPVSGDTMTVVIGCHSHTEMEEISEADALTIAELALLDRDPSTER